MGVDYEFVLKVAKTNLKGMGNSTIACAPWCHLRVPSLLVMELKITTKSTCCSVRY